MPKHLKSLAFFMFLGCALTWAQTETGQISGTVLDPTGAAVPQAKVTARSLATGAVRSTTTDESGTFVLPNLLPATYELTVEASGFATAKRQLAIAPGARIGVDISLEVGRAETVVTVAENLITVNTETQTLGQVITGKQIVELPTLTRNPYALVALAGNVSEDDPSGRGAGYSINGQRAAGTNILLDGSSNNDEFTASVGQEVPLDSVQELTLLTNNFTAEYGRASAGVVNVVTKSGTNDFHGTLYEFNRVSRLASNTAENNANGVPKPVFTRNQFGYSIGGPIIRDKLFFFNNTEWIRVRSASTRVAYVPTQELISRAAPETRQFFSELGQLRPNLVTLGSLTRNDMVAQGFDPCGTSAPDGPCRALPGNLPLFTRVAYNRPANSGGGTPQDTYELVGRVDYNLSDRTQLYARYALLSRNSLKGSNADSPYSGFDSGNTDFNNNILFTVLHSFSPRWISQSKAVFNRLNNLQPLGDRPVVPTLYLASGSTATRILGTNVAMPGYLPFSPGNAIPFGGPQNYAQLYQDMSYVIGRHQWRFGGQYTYIRDNRTFGAYQTAVEQVGRNFGNGMDNFLLGRLYSFQAAINPQGKYPCGATVTPDCIVTLPVGPPNFSRSNRYHEFAFYGQDTWKVTPRLTLNLGLRWEYFGVQHNKNPRLDSNFYEASTGNIFERIRNGRVMLAPESPVGGLWAKDWNNFAPRVGIAWDPTGDGRMSIRGGYGISYERNFGNVTFNVIQNPPNYAVISLLAGVDIPQLFITTNNAGPLAGSSGSKALPRVSLRNVDMNIRTAYVHMWSAVIERRISKFAVGAIEYSGSKGVNLYSLENPNRPGSGNLYLGDPCTPGSCTSRLINERYTNINKRSGNAFNQYHGLNLRFQVQGWQGLQLSSNYTWSHAIDNLSSTFSESANNYNLGLLDPFNPRLDKGDADYDVRHRFTLGAHWEMPWLRERKLARAVFGGWAIAPLFTAQTGTPFSLFDCGNALAVCPRAILAAPIPSSGLKNPPPAGTPNRFRYLDYSGKMNLDWVNPKLGISDFGPFPSSMLGRNALRTPGRYMLHLAVHKNIYFGEITRLQFRAEAFNVLNHSNLFAIIGDADVSSATYVSAQRGNPTATDPDNRRNVQLALKFIF